MKNSRPTILALLFIVGALIINSTPSLAHRSRVNLLDTEAANVVVMVKIGSEAGKLISRENGSEWLQRALKDAKQIKNETYREETLALVANELAGLGQVSQAIDITRNLKDKHLKVTTLGKIAQKLAAIQPKTADQLLAEAVDEARTCKDQVDKAALLAELAGKYGKLGNAAKGLELMDAACEEVSQLKTADAEVVGTLAEIAANFSALKQKEKAMSYFEKAAELTRSLNDAFDKAACLAMLGGEFAEKGCPGEAVKMLREASLAAEQINNAGKKDDILSEIARNFSHAKDYDQALAIAGQIKDNFWRSEALIRVGKNYSKQKEYNKAMAVLEQANQAAITTTAIPKRSLLLAKLATEYADALQQTQALQSLNAAIRHSGS